MDRENRLGIIVNSNRYFGFVEKLAHAALEQRKQVSIHLLGSGCEFVETDACTRLYPLVRMTLCLPGGHQKMGNPRGHSLPGVSVVPPRELSRFLKDCHRYVVF